MAQCTETSVRDATVLLSGDMTGKTVTRNVTTQKDDKLKQAWLLLKLRNSNGKPNQNMISLQLRGIAIKNVFQLNECGDDFVIKTYKTWLLCYY